MFSFGENTMNIGERNVEAVKQKLKEMVFRYWQATPVQIMEERLNLTSLQVFC